MRKNFVEDQENQNLTKGDARAYLHKLIVPLEWSYLEEETENGEWHAYGASEHVIYFEDGQYVYWAEGEGPTYGTLEEAQAAANANHEDEILRFIRV